MAVKEIYYPSKVEDPNTVLNQELLDMSTAQLMSWQQGVGRFGQLQMHACWGQKSSLLRRYHGQTISRSYVYLKGMMQLFDHTRDARWRWFADDIVANVLNLQAPDGGFFHSGDAGEPTYLTDHDNTCPIHQGFACLTLLNYLGWEHALPDREERIHLALQRNFKWFCREWWQYGNTWAGRLKTPGFCGVTNQDLVVIAAMAKYMKVCGEARYFEQYGKPALDYFLSPEVYYEALGLFERCDKPNFAERTGYNYVILDVLEYLYACTEDARISQVIDNVRAHLFDAAYEEDDGLLYLAWGAQTDPVDKSHIIGWDRYPHVLTDLPYLLWHMKAHLARFPDQEKQEIVNRLERTLAAYVYADGTQALNLRGGDAVFQIAGTFVAPLWLYLIRRLGSEIQSPQPVRVPTVHRKCGNLVWKSNERLWSLEMDGKRCFAGLKANESALAIGPEEGIYGADFATLEEPDFVEHIPLLIK
ncbi:hypothetical protein [Coraliomargarita parva]|uniref:hypothetical protein n=1 Tax=Coraliomargarita parva TaxID=3014050 RepID=UPI0022B2C9CA|nr:hypothetical protein [Coraliomargarita parva]